MEYYNKNFYKNVYKNWTLSDLGFEVRFLEGLILTNSDTHELAEEWRNRKVVAENELRNKSD